MDGATPHRYRYTVAPEDPRTTAHWLLEFAAGARDVLDVGCAEGRLAALLGARGARVTGVEADPDAEVGARAACADFVLADVEHAAGRGRVRGRFDAVVLADVLEHLRDPGGLLVHAREQWLAPAGRVVVSVPNCGHWAFRREVLRGRFPQRESGLFDRTHVRFFTRASLLALVRRSGFDVTREAVTANFNTADLTFGLLAPLYRRRLPYRALMALESRLARLLPGLFGYQFVLELRPSERSEVPA